MRTIAIPVHDDDYERVQVEVARRHQSLAELFTEFVTDLRGGSERRSGERAGGGDSVRRRQWLERLREVRSTVGVQRPGGSEARPPRTSSIVSARNASE